MQSREFEATTQNLKNIRSFIELILKNYSFNHQLINEIKLVVGEATTNILKYGYKESDPKNKILIELNFNHDNLEIHIFDNGVKVTKEMVKHRNLDDVKPEKIGSYFIKNIMDYFDWSEKKCSWTNHLILKKKITNFNEKI